MDIQIDTSSDVAAYRQLAEQIAFLIATGTLKPGDSLPSVRELARRHKIHKDTVSHAYQNLVDRNWIKRHRGKTMRVRAPAEPIDPQPENLDDLIDAVVRHAREHRYTMEELRRRIRRRLLAQPPNHVLLIEEDSGMRQLLLHELTELLPFTITACSPDHLTENQSLAAGALIVSMGGGVWRVDSLHPFGRQVYRLKPSGIDLYVDRIRKLKRPSLIVIISISELFLQIARTLLVPFCGGRHTIETLHLENGTRNLAGMDLVFCDSMCRPRLRAGHLVHYQLVSNRSVAEISKLVKKGDR
jgi:DNA-binding transcriptional regulator YhcF (GntR family)